MTFGFRGDSTQSTQREELYIDVDADADAEIDAAITTLFSPGDPTTALPRRGEGGAGSGH